VKLLEMSDYNRAARIYWSVMVVAGTLTGAWGFYQCLAFNVAEWAQFLSLLSLVIVTGCYPIRIPNTTATVTVGDTFTFLSVLFLGVPAAIMLSVVDAFLGSTRATKPRRGALNSSHSSACGNTAGSSTTPGLPPWASMIF